MPFQEKKSVIVIGAGLAGLTAAYRLHQKGHAVDVYEARNRPGGRIYTAYFDNGYEELGGKSINDGKEAKYIKALIKELEMEIEYAPFLLQGAYLNSHVISFSTLFKNAEEPTQELYNYLLECKERFNNLEEILNEFFAKNSFLCELMKKVMTDHEGASPDQLSREYIDQIWDLYKLCYERAKLCESEHLSINDFAWVKGGNSRLIHKLIAQMGGNVHYQAILQKLVRNADGKYQISFKNGDLILADYVILALPCSTLKDVDLKESGIPEDQLNAIQNLQFGTNSKLLFPVSFPSNSTPTVGFSENGTIWFNAESSIGTCYFGGKPGVFDSETMQDVADQELPSIRALYPSLNFTHGTSLVNCNEEFFPHFSEPVAISWQSEEFSKGSYSYKSSQDGDLFLETIMIEGRLVKKAFRPVDSKLFFAGEHTSLECSATMEGAVESGELAAYLLDFEKKTRF